jgi:hypothetical protein
MAAKIGGETVYTQKALAAMLGVSTRTLRRAKNIPGYKLAPATLDRIKEPLDGENRRWRANIKGKAFDPKTGKLEKSAKFKLPTLPVQPLPTIYRAKKGGSQTLKIDSDLWKTKEKSDYLKSALKSGRFISWTARIKVPVGVATSGSGFQDGDEINEEDRAVHYMIGPFTLQAHTERGAYGLQKQIEKELKYHEDAGRIVMNISIVENLPGQSE